MKTLKLRYFVFGLIAVILLSFAILSLTGCPPGEEEDPDGKDPGKNNGSGEDFDDPDVPPEDLHDKDRWYSSVHPESTATLDLSVADDGVCTMIVGGVVDHIGWHTQGKYNFTAKVNTSYTYVFEAWTDTGTRNLAVSYYDNAFDDYDNRGGYFFSIDTTRKAFTLIGPRVTKAGVRTFEFSCAGQLGTFYVKIISITETPPGGELPENWPVADRWCKYIDSTSTATITYSVDNDGVCTITIGGTAMDAMPAWDNIWKAAASYKYTAEKGEIYTYEFEAWTDGADRTMLVQWHEDSAAGVYHHTGYDGTTTLPIFTITSEQKTYTITGEKPIPKSGIQHLSFLCANQTGTFYVKVLSIIP
jgi:hypothetical protein